ncbi:MAG: tryptophan synthase subunit alpha [Vampirovibrio sp.]|nr:tryptophan synthase subunit alpha [Vampirovibrio sp.]
MTTQATTRFTNQLHTMKTQNQKGFIPFTLLGWPNADISFEIIKTMIDSGATGLELGIAFSDPLADGPVLQAAAVETLATGFDVDQAFILLQKVRAYNQDIPIGLMVYFNMILARGVDQFFKDAADAGVDGILIVDLPPEGAEEVTAAAKTSGIDLIFIVSPLTTDERLQTILKHANGYLYVVSRLGITGTDNTHDTQLQDLLTRIKAQTDLPLYVGFGVSTPEDAQKMIAAGADGVITGSRIIQLVQDQPNSSPQQVLETYLQSMCNLSE